MEREFYSRFTTESEVTRDMKTVLGQEHSTKFVIIEPAADGENQPPQKVYFSNGKTTQHIDIFEQVDREHSGYKFIGAGLIRTNGELEWGSITCTMRFEHDRPDDIRVQEFLLEQVKIQFQELIKQ